MVIQPSVPHSLVSDKFLSFLQLVSQQKDDSNNDGFRSNLFNAFIIHHDCAFQPTNRWRVQHYKRRAYEHDNFYFRSCLRWYMFSLWTFFFLTLCSIRSLNSRVSQIIAWLSIALILRQWLVLWVKYSVAKRCLSWQILCTLVSLQTTSSWQYVHYFKSSTLAAVSRTTHHN